MEARLSYVIRKSRDRGSHVSSTPVPLILIGKKGCYVETWLDDVINCSAAILSHDISRICFIAPLMENTIDCVLLVKVDSLVMNFK